MSNLPDNFNQRAHDRAFGTDAGPLWRGDDHARSIAACAGALVKLGVPLEDTNLDEVLASHIHDMNSTHPDDADERAAEWKEAHRVAGLLIANYERNPAAAASWLTGAFAEKRRAA